MTAFRLSQACEICSVEADAVNLFSNVAVLSASEINETFSFVHAVERANLPFSIRDLAYEMTVRRVMIKMQPAAALAAPKERAVLQPAWIINGFNPCLSLFCEQCRRLSISDARRVQVEICLFTVLRLINHALTVRRPGDANQ